MDISCIGCEDWAGCSNTDEAEDLAHLVLVGLGVQLQQPGGAPADCPASNVLEVHADGHGAQQRLTEALGTEAVVVKVAAPGKLSTRKSCGASRCSLLVWGQPA